MTQCQSESDAVSSQNFTTSVVHKPPTGSRNSSLPVTLDVAMSAVSWSIPRCQSHLERRAEVALQPARAAQQQVDVVGRLTAQSTAHRQPAHVRRRRPVQLDERGASHGRHGRAQLGVERGKLGPLKTEGVGGRERGRAGGRAVGSEERHVYSSKGGGENWR